MKILALEVENPTAAADDFAPHLKAETHKVLELMREDFIREIYFRADQNLAVLILECTDRDEAQERLAELPLVQKDLISFEIIPLNPYPGFSRLLE